MYVYDEKALSTNTILVNGSRTLNALFKSSGYSSFTSAQKAMRKFFFKYYLK
jgi:hypothetical protein